MRREKISEAKKIKKTDDEIWNKHGRNLTEQKSASKKTRKICAAKEYITRENLQRKRAENTKNEYTAQQRIF